MPDESDAQLLERARAGNDAALETLLARHQTRVYRFGMRMCRDPEVAKDVLQDTLLALARGVREFRGDSSLSTWLYRIARSFCVKKRRRRSFVPNEERSLDVDGTASGRQLADPARAPDEVLAGKQVERALERAIGALEPKYREVLLLRDVEGLTAPEVAEVLGVSVDAVKSRLHRARLSVRAQLVPLLGTPTDATAAVGPCPDVLTLFSRHLEGEISAETCAEMQAHLLACGRCRGACDSLQRSLALCRTTAPMVQVPTSVQASVQVALRNFLAGKG